MDKRTLRVGDVVQIDPEHDPRFGACFMAVTEPTTWGAQGFVQVPGSAGQAYYRCPFEGMEYVGRAAFVLPPYPEERELAEAEPTPEVHRPCSNEVIAEAVPEVDG